MTTQTAIANQVSQQDEQQITLPTRTLVVTQVVTALIFGGLLSLGVLFGAWEGDSLPVGLLGIAIVAVMSLASLMAMAPWKKRCISFWMTLWLGGTVFRLLITPVVLYVLYSAVSFNGTSQLAVVGICYMVTLFSEAIIIALHVKRNLVD